MIRSWYKGSIYYRLYNILVVPYKKLLKKEGEGRAGSRIISSGWLRKKQKMSAIYFKALLQNGCDNWHPCQNALWAKRSSKDGKSFRVHMTISKQTKKIHYFFLKIILLSTVRPQFSAGKDIELLVELTSEFTVGLKDT